MTSLDDVHYLLLMTPPYACIDAASAEVDSRSCAFPFEVLAQMASSVEGAPFDGRHCQTEPSSSFGVRQPLQFAKQSNGT